MSWDQLEDREVYEPVPWVKLVLWCGLSVAVVIGILWLVLP